MKILLCFIVFFSRALFCFAGIPEYDLNIQISPDSKQMLVRGEMKIPGKQEPQGEVQFALSELIKNFDVQIMAPVPENNPKIAKTLRSWDRPGWGQHTWTITPADSIPASTPVVLRFSYTYSGEQAGFILSASERCFFAAGIGSAWYPQIEESPRTDDGIRLRGLRSIGNLHFTLPEEWVVYSPGVHKKANDQVEFRIDEPLFFSFAAGKYSTSKTSDPLLVSLYQLEARGERMKNYLAQATRILQVLAAEFGDYPYPEFAIAEVPPEEANKAGFAGASLDGFMLATTDFLNQDFNTAYYGHEIGHQWWGGVVRPDGPEGRWILTEAMAQYGSLRAVELLEGPARAELYRRKGYPGYLQDQSGFGYLMLAAAGMDQPLTKLSADGSLPRWLADSKGFLVWDMLSRHMGREKFSSVLKNIITKYQGKRIRWKSFVQEINKSSDQDLSWFFNQWFDNTGAPEWRLKWQHQSEKLTIQISQHAPYFRFNVSAEIHGTNGERLIKQFSIDTGDHNWNLDVPFEVKSVEIDPHFQLLNWTEEYKKEATALAPYTRALLQHNDGNLNEARKLFEEGLKKIPSPDVYGLGFLLQFGFSRFLYEQNEIQASKMHLEIALSSPTKRPEHLPWAYLQLAEIADQQKDTGLVCSALQSVIAADRSALDKTGAVEHIGPLSKKHQCPVTP